MMKNVFGKMVLACTAIALGLCGQANAGTISVNFSQGAYNLSASTTAGLVNVDNWNNVNNTQEGPPFAIGTVSNLVDNTGATTAASVSYQAYGTYDGYTAPNTASAGTNTLYQGGFYGNPQDGNPSHGTEVSVTVSGLTYGSYNVYVYFGGAGGGASTHTVGLTTSAGTFYSVGNGNVAGTTSLSEITSTDSTNPTVAGAGYVEFLGSGSSFTVTTTDSLTNVAGAVIYGVQVDAVPEPSTFALLGLGGLSLAIRVLRRRAAAV